MWHLSRQWYRGRLDANFQPASRDDLQALLTGIGLVGEFWSLG